MKVFNRRLFSALVTVGMLGVVGCGPDNEAEGQKLARQAGRPRKVDGQGADGGTSSTEDQRRPRLARSARWGRGVEAGRLSG